MNLHLPLSGDRGQRNSRYATGRWAGVLYDGSPVAAPWERVPQGLQPQSWEPVLSIVGADRVCAAGSTGRQLGFLGEEARFIGSGWASPQRSPTCSVRGAAHYCTFPAGHFSAERYQESISVKRRILTLNGRARREGNRRRVAGVFCRHVKLKRARWS